MTPELFRQFANKYTEDEVKYVFSNISKEKMQ